MLTAPKQKVTMLTMLTMLTAAQNRETLERTCYNLRDEVKELDGKVDHIFMFDFHNNNNR